MIEEADPCDVRLKVIGNDKKIEVGGGVNREGVSNKQMPWVVKMMGD
jgi:hypothetical protein